MKIPDPNNSIAALIDRAHEERNDRPRPHLGCSMLGHPCDRWLWLSFRWAVVERFPGRILRLFRRGHMEESTIVSDLRAIGIDIQSTGKSQARVHFGAHVSGSIDGIIYSGVPEAPKKKHLAEFKTSSKKAFDDTVKKGVKASKPVHYAQMQVYMYGKDIDRALYLVVCKDDDRIYTERVRLDKKEAERLIELLGHFHLALVALIVAVRENEELQVRLLDPPPDVLADVCILALRQAVIDDLGAAQEFPSGLAGRLGCHDVGEGDILRVCGLHHGFHFP